MKKVVLYLEIFGKEIEYKPVMEFRSGILFQSAKGTKIFLTMWEISHIEEVDFGNDVKVRLLDFSWLQ